MARRNRSYKKGKPFRDASLFVIICEGAKREPQYLELLAEDSKKIKVEIITPKENKSSPDWLLDAAAEFVSEYQLGKKDQLWFVLDVDAWKPEQLIKLGKTCEENKVWSCAISNPCFEVWLFMHYADISKATAENCGEFKAELPKIVEGGYRKEEAIQNLEIAITRAKLADSNPTHFMPNLKSTKVYQLIEALLEKKNRP
jgi:hypothetical protein